MEANIKMLCGFVLLLSIFVVFGFSLPLCDSFHVLIASSAIICYYAELFANTCLFVFHNMKIFQQVPWNGGTITQWLRQLES